MTCFSLKQLKIIKTCSLFLSYAVSGLSMTVIGASLLDLQDVVKTDSKSIAFVFVARSAAYLFGLLFGAPLLDKTFRKLLAMTVLNFLMAMTITAVPLSRNIEILLGWMALNGIAIGALDTGLNTYCLNLWGEDSGPIFQAQTFTFGFGGLIAPLIVAPYLGQYVLAEGTSTSTVAFGNRSGLSGLREVLLNTFNSTISNVSLKNFSGMPNVEDTFQSISFTSSSSAFAYPVVAKDTSVTTSSIFSSSALPKIGELLNVYKEYFNQSVIDGANGTSRNVDDSGVFPIPKIFYGYAIIGGIAFLVTLLFVILCIIAPVDDTKHKNVQEDDIEKSKTFIGVVVLLTFLLLFVELGLQMGYGLAVATYAVKGPLRQSNRVGSYVASLYWSSFTLSRFCAIFYVLKFSNLSLILSSLLVKSSGALVLLFFQEEEWALWLSSFLVGFGVSPFFSTAISWIEQYITVTNKFMALFSAGYCFGEMFGPYVITSYVEEKPEVLGYMVAVSCLVAVPLILSMYLMLRNKPKKYQKKEGVSNKSCDAKLDKEVYI